ncbi:sodium-and chloride-dependent glycine transporter 2 [Trichonephila clavipes]|uniref:Sodium-and chloride-dependent glycine transporter 2 n=1 Tax=Trichonephila clavipes TaxID=2585209 RepID=A0A8X6WJ27_TRICX|nr:sodium-and chloride-dependent glycine transporter 2 [Trichonephila clavipes]
MVIAIWNQPGSTIKEKFLRAIKPTEEWGPSDDLIKEYYKAHMDGQQRSATNGDDASVRYLAQSNNESGMLEYL